MVVSKNLKIWILLVILTIVAVASSSELSTYSTALLLGLAFMKFIGVSFFFMEVKKAHLIYKLFIVFFCLLLFSLLFLL